MIKKILLILFLLTIVTMNCSYLRRWYVVHSVEGFHHIIQYYCDGICISKNRITQFFNTCVFVLIHSENS